MSHPSVEGTIDPQHLTQHIEAVGAEEVSQMLLIVSNSLSQAVLEGQIPEIHQESTKNAIIRLNELRDSIITAYCLV